MLRRAPTTPPQFIGFFYLDFGTKTLTPSTLTHTDTYTDTYTDAYTNACSIV